MSYEGDEYQPYDDSQTEGTSEPINPVQIEQIIRHIANRIANGVKVCSERYDAFKEAERVYETAFARAYIDYDGPAHAKKYAATLATQQEREAMDAADGLYRYADRNAKALTEQLRAYQSVGASTRTMYGSVGVG